MTQSHHDPDESFTAPSTFLLVAIGFFISFVAFFVLPIFLNPQHMMKFPWYIPAWEPIGTDLQTIMITVRRWWIENHEYWFGYPPLGTLCFVPLLYVPFFSAYTIMAILTLVSYVCLALGVPYLLTRDRGLLPFLVLFFATGLMSYGLHYEIERGQFNVIAVALGFTGIYLFHRHKRLRILSYLLLTLSIHLKIYPAIFILFFVDDWREWRTNLIRWTALGVLNLALLFILGFSTCANFISALREVGNAAYPVPDNQSIAGFVAFWGDQLSYRDVQGLARSVFILLRDHAALMRDILYTATLGLLGLSWFRMFTTQQRGMNPHLLLASTLVALLLPGVSIDYKLPLLAAPTAMYLRHLDLRLQSPTRDRFGRLLVLLVSTIYAATLFGFSNKSFIFQNNMPFLLAILLLTTLYEMTRRRKPDPPPYGK